MKDSEPKSAQDNEMTIPTSTRQRATKESSSRPAKFEDFSPEPLMTEPERAAAFLDWAADNMPHRIVPYTWLTRAAYAKTSTPRETHPDVGTVRHKLMRRVKDILWKEYERRVVPETAKNSTAGVRATVDSDDLAATDYLRRVKRIANGTVAAQETRAKIDVAEMNNPQMKALVQRMDPVMKRLGKDNMLKMLELPPPSSDDE